MGPDRRTATTAAKAAAGRQPVCPADFGTAAFQTARQAHSTRAAKKTATALASSPQTVEGRGAGRGQAAASTACPTGPAKNVATANETGQPPSSAQAAGTASACRPHAEAPAAQPTSRRAKASPRRPTSSRRTFAAEVSGAANAATAKRRRQKATQKASPPTSTPKELT